MAVAPRRSAEGAEPHRRVGTPRRARAVAVASLLPGLGHLLTGRVRVGVALLGAAVVAGGLLLAATIMLSPLELTRLAVRPNVLLGVTIVVVFAGLGWCASILSAYRSARPARMTRAQAAGSHALVYALCAAVMTPMIWGAQQVHATRTALDVFEADPARSTAAPRPGPGTDPGSARPSESGLDPAAARSPGPGPGASPEPTSDPEPFPDTDRVTLLLLGSDGAANRDGTRTDTLVLASIDTRTGRTALISLPRNLQNVPLRPGTELAAAYPQGFPDFWFGLYTAAESDPDLMPDTDPDRAGAAAITDTVSYVTGTDVDYYAVIDMKGFQRLIDRLGGVHLDVRSGSGEPIPIGGSHGADGSVTSEPSGRIALGQQHLDGHEALWYARSRFAASDDARQARQRCLLTAMAAQLDPDDVFDAVRDLRKAARHVLLTDIPASVLPDFIDLAAEHGPDAEIDRISVLDVIGSSAEPDIDALRDRVAAAVEGTAGASAHQDHGVARPICPDL